MIKSINVKEENCFITIESHYKGSVIVWYVDELFDIRKRLATYNKGKWNYSSPQRMNELIQLLKGNTPLKKALYSCLHHSANEEELPVVITWKCFKRTSKLKSTRIFRNLKKRIWPRKK